MKSDLRRFLILILSLGLPAGAFGDPTFEDIQTAVLPNGFKILVRETREFPLVSLRMCYKVGFRDAPPKAFEMPHFIEHLLFEGTASYPGETFSRKATENGGLINGHTTYVATTYENLVTPTQWKTVIDLELSRMTEGEFASKVVQREKQIVMSEIKGSLSPADQLWKGVYGKLGSRFADLFNMNVRLKGLESITADQAKAFYTTYYRPDNAFLVVVGDIDAQQVLDYARSKFEKVTNPQEPIVRAAEELKAITNSEKLTYKGGENTYIRKFVFNFLPEKPRSKEYAIYDFIRYSEIFGGFSAISFDKTGYMFMNAENMFKKPFDGLDWKSVEAQFPDAKARALETIGRLPGDLDSWVDYIVESELKYGDFKEQAWFEQEIRKLQFSDLQAFVKQYLQIPLVLTALYEYDQTLEAGANSVKDSRDNFSEKSNFGFLSDGGPELIAEYSRNLEENAALVGPKLGEFAASVKSFTLANGLTVWHTLVPAHREFELTLFVPAGFSREPLPYLSDFTSRIVFETGPQQPLKALLNKRGWEWGVRDVTPRFVSFRLDADQSLLSDVLGGLTALLTPRTWDPSVLRDAQGRKFLNDDHAGGDSLWQPAYRVLREWGLFSEDRFDPGRNQWKGITPQDIDLFWRQNYGPNGSFLLISSSLDTESLQAELEKTLAGWRSATQKIAEFTDWSWKNTPSEVIRKNISPLTKENRVLFRLPLPQSPRTTKDLQALDLGAEMLQGFTGRLFRELRTKKGLSYSTHFYRSVEDASGPQIWNMEFETAPSTTGTLIREVKKLMTEFIEEGPSDLEMVFAKNLSINHWLMNSMGDNESKHSYLSGLILSGKTPDGLAEHFDVMMSLTAEDLKAVWKKYFNPEKMIISTSGPGW